MRTQHLFMLLVLWEAVFALMVGDHAHTISLHDTYIVVAQAHVRWGGVVLALFYAAVHAAMERVGRAMGQRLGRVIFALTLFGLVLPTTAMMQAVPFSDGSLTALVLLGMVSLVLGMVLCLVSLVVALLRIRTDHP